LLNVFFANFILNSPIAEQKQIQTNRGNKLESIGNQHFLSKKFIVEIFLRQIYVHKIRLFPNTEQQQIQTNRGNTLEIIGNKDFPSTNLIAEFFRQIYVSNIQIIPKHKTKTNPNESRKYFGNHRRSKNSIDKRNCWFFISQIDFI